MAGSRIPGPLNENSRVADDSTSTAREVESPAPIGTDASDAIELTAFPKISKVTKDWADPPAVTPKFTPEVSGKTLKAVLVELQKLSEWGTGGGNLSGTGDDGQITAEPTSDGKSFTIALKGDFFMTLPKWKEYDAATKEQKASWDAMIANLRKHEREHVDISYRNAEKLIRAVTNIPADQAIQKVADSQTTTQAAQEDFDTKTLHGGQAFGQFPEVTLDVSADPPPPQKP